MTSTLNRLALTLLAGTALVATSALAQTVHPRETGPVAASPAGAAVTETERAPMLTFAAPGVDAYARTRSHSHKAAPAASSSSYKVKKGDTLAEIADRMGSDVATLAKLNHLKKPYNLTPGQTIHGPSKGGSAAEEAPAKSSGKKAKPETYTVQSGDTLYSIAKRFGVSVEDLKAANGLGRSSSIARGRKLTLPGAGGAGEAREEPARRGREPAAEPASSSSRAAQGRVVEVETGGKAVKVKKGESLERVARRMGVDQDDLIRINHLKKPYHLKAGQTLRGPGGASKAYIVARGDTLASIAERFDVSVAQLRAANGLSKKATTVAPGRKLRLPAGYRDRGGREPSYEPPVGRTLPPTRSESERLPSTPQPYNPSGAPTQNLPPAAPSVSDAQIMQLGRGLFAWPLKGDVISGFGDKGTSQRNDGVNIRANAGDPVRAAAAGDVVYAGDQVPGFGNLVLIQHADGWVTAYGNLGKVGVRMQQKVAQGQQIGEAGNTGGVSEPQLHFEVRYRPNPGDRARPIDPMLVLPK